MTVIGLLNVLCMSSRFSQAQQRAAGAGAVQTGRRMYCGTSARSAASPCGSADGSAAVPTSTWRYSYDPWSRSESGSRRPLWLCSTWTSGGPSRSSTREQLLRRVSAAAMWGGDRKQVCVGGQVLTGGRNDLDQTHYCIILENLKHCSHFKLTEILITISSSPR